MNILILSGSPRKGDIKNTNALNVTFELGQQI